MILFCSGVWSEGYALMGVPLLSFCRERELERAVFIAEPVE